MRRRSNIPQPRYYLAILRALAAMGGSGDVDDVLRRVERELRPSFGPEELAPVNSYPNEPSWRNTARWARADMVTGGLLRRDSPHGTWEISDAGRLYLQRNSANPSDHSADQPRPATEAFSRETPHTLNEDFSYKRPSAFVLQGRRYNYVSSWRHLYELVCQQLYSKDPALFASLLDHPGLKGKKLFTTDPQSLLAPVQVGGGLYAEGNKSARDIAQQIRRLLAIFRIPEDQMVIYLSPGD